MNSRQNLPVPLGGLLPIHVRASRLARHWRLQRSRLLAATGLLLAGAGAWLSVGVPPDSVYARGLVVHIAGSTLVRSQQQGLAGARVYSGDVALVVATGSDGSTRAGAATTLNGQAASGTCHMRIAGASAVERCTFMLGAQVLRATDTYAAGERIWHRRYSDGTQTTFTVPTGATLVPIPLPLGR